MYLPTKRWNEQSAHRAAAQRGIESGLASSLDMDSASDSPLCGDKTLKRRSAQDEFVARGLRSKEHARRTSSYHPAETVHDELQPRLKAWRKPVLGYPSLGARPLFDALVRVRARQKQ